LVCSAGTRFHPLAEVELYGIRQDCCQFSLATLPRLKLTLEVLRDGDTLVVWKLDRQGRSVKGLVDLVNQLADMSLQNANFS
jgi:hypothetical protein